MQLDSMMIMVYQSSPSILYSDFMNLCPQHICLLFACSKYIILDFKIHPLKSPNPNLSYLFWLEVETLEYPVQEEAICISVTSRLAKADMLKW